MIKKVILVSFLLLSLNSCGSATVTTTEDSALTTYKGSEFSLDIPSIWEIKDLKNSGSINLPNPRVGNMELVASAKEEKSGFINNMIILSKDLDIKTTSYDYISKNNPKDYKGYQYYYEDTAKDITFNDGEKSKIYIFIAKYNKDNDKLKFMQTARVCGEKKVFFLTIGLSLNINDTAKYEEIFRSFKCN